jgi:hypothetical protein
VRSIDGFEPGGEEANAQRSRYSKRGDDEEEDGNLAEGLKR